MTTQAPPPWGADRWLVRGDAQLRWRFEAGGTGIALVLIHGWALSLEYWSAVVPLLAVRHRLLRYDRRGFGASRGPYDPGSACEDLLGILDAAHIERACLVGMSQGARVAIHAAIRAPDRIAALVLDGAPRFEAETELPLAQYRHLRDVEGLPALHAALLEHPLMRLAAPDAQRQVLLERCVATYRGIDLEGGWAPVPAPRLEAITQPTLVLNGSDDSAQRREAGERLRTAITGARRIQIPGAAHLAALDQSAQWAQAVLDFAAEVDATVAYRT
jgi:pimeloyl-ACP methyl ester carboxylesterase